MFLLVLRSDALTQINALALVVQAVASLTPDQRVYEETFYIEFALRPVNGQVDLDMLEEALNDLGELLRILEISDQRVLLAMAGMRALIKGYHTLPVALLSEQVGASNCGPYLESVPSGGDMGV